MSHVQTGSCSRCGAPIYSPSAWGATVPPPAVHSCSCWGSGLGKAVYDDAPLPKLLLKRTSGTDAELKYDG